MNKLTCFKAYDIRGQLGDELNNDIAYRIGRAFAEYLKPSIVVVGGDIRLTSKELKESISDGLRDAGCDVIDIGMVGTEEIYFATHFLRVDGGIEVTASHNPINYNGMKLVRKGAKPISGDTGLRDIQRLAEENDFSLADKRGELVNQSNLIPYVDHLLTYLNLRDILPLKVVVNAGNGAAGHVIDEIESRFRDASVPIDFVKIHHQADGCFPNGIPNPLLSECRKDTMDAVLANDADIGIAWDGDFDRCFFFDEKGQFIEGYYIVGLLAEAFLKKESGAKIIHDPRLTWNTIEIVRNSGGIPVQCKTGHAFIKERMRAENAIYGGEMSAHHYFRDFAYCDSGMIPWLLMIELISKRGLALSSLVTERISAYPISGEINIMLKNAEASIKKVKENYYDFAKVFDDTDGVSFEFDDWRFNLRFSNTESVVRLNVESKGSPLRLKKKTAEILSILEKS